MTTTETRVTEVKKLYSIIAIGKMFDCVMSTCLLFLVVKLGRLMVKTVFVDYYVRDRHSSL